MNFNISIYKTTIHLKNVIIIIIELPTPDGIIQTNEFKSFTSRIVTIQGVWPIDTWTKTLNGPKLFPVIFIFIFPEVDEFNGDAFIIYVFENN